MTLQLLSAWIDHFRKFNQCAIEIQWTNNSMAKRSRFIASGEEDTLFILNHFVCVLFFSMDESIRKVAEAQQENYINKY